MRLFQCMAGGAVGGAEEFFVRLAGGFARAGVTQLCAVRPNPARNGAMRAAGVTLCERRFGGWLDWRTAWLLRRDIAAFKPDVVLSWMNRATRAAPAGRGRFVKVARLGGYYDLKYYRDCDYLIGNTRDIVDYLVGQGWPSARAIYLPNFVDDRRAAAIGRATFDTPADVPLILTLGRLHENKGFDVLLAALAELPDAYVWMAGDGPCASALQRQAADLGVADRVRFLGWRRDVAALFASADIYCCPSRHEPLGNVVLEAWAQARPVVACASQGPAALISDGETGLLSPIDDPSGLAANLRALIDAPQRARALAMAGRAAFERDYTEAVVVARYLDFFAGITG